MTRRLLTMLTASVSVAAAPGAPLATALGAQTDVTIEVGASQIGPPVGLDAESARFAVGGLRASHYGLSGSGIHGSILAGRAIGEANGGDFLTGTLGGTLSEQWSRSVRGTLEIRMLAFAVRAPYPYDAVAVEGGPSVTFGAGPVSLELAAVAGSGRSRFELWRVAGGPTRVFEDELARVGGTTELTLGTGTVRVALAGGLHGTPAGSFGSGGARILLAGSWGAVEARADVWRTPAGTESTGGLALVIPLSGWSVRGFFGRSEPDPLTLAEPGSASGGLLLGRSLYARPAGGPTAPRSWEILSTTSAGARVRLALDAPAGARTVSLLGDFTLWDEVPMHPRNGRWEVEVEVPPGTHHYGFLVDDEWHVPDDAREVVPDEWGRLSAILVIEGVE